MGVVGEELKPVLIMHRRWLSESYLPNDSSLQNSFHGSQHSQTGPVVHLLLKRVCHLEMQALGSSKRCPNTIILVFDVL